MKMIIKTTMSRFRTIIAGGVLLCTATAASAATYNINFDGSTIDLFGFIETNALGSFSPLAFDGQVIDYEVTASVNGSSPFLFTLANSTWQSRGSGNNVSINITPTMIELTAPSGGIFDPDNLFLIADVITNSALENLRLFQDQLGFRTPNPPNVVDFETVSPTFVLAVSPVPAPAAFQLFGAALGVMGFIGWRRKRKAAAA